MVPISRKCEPGCTCGRHRKDTPERARQRREVMVGKNVGQKRGSPSEEHREKNRRAQLGNQRARGYKDTPEQRIAKGRRSRQMWLDGVFDHRPPPTRGKPGYYNGIYMRCLNSEGVFARELDRANIKWEYEPKRFLLSVGSYLPDFYLPEFDIWVEVKGYMSEGGQLKVDAFRRETGKTLTVIYCHELPYRRFYQDGD